MKKMVDTDKLKSDVADELYDLLLNSENLNLDYICSDFVAKMGMIEIIEKTKGAE